MKALTFRIVIILFMFSIVSCNKEEFNEIEKIQTPNVQDELNQLKERFNLDIRKATPEEAKNAIPISYEDLINLLEQRELSGSLFSINKLETRAVEELEGRYYEKSQSTEITGEAGIPYGPKNDQTTLKLDFLFNLNNWPFVSATSLEVIYLKINQSAAENIITTSKRIGHTLVSSHTFYISFTFDINGKIYTITNPFAQLSFTFHQLLGIFTYTYVF